MHLDVRLPIGVLFGLIGIVVAVYGAMMLDNPATRPTGVPIDVVWGIVMLAFGVAMLALAARASRRIREGGSESNQGSIHSTG